MARVSPRNVLLVVFSLALVAILLTLESRKKTSHRKLLPEISQEEEDSLSEGMFRQMDHLYRMEGVDCKGILEGDQTALTDAQSKVSRPQWKGLHRTDHHYMEETKSCDAFIRNNGYITSVLSEEENDFPLAYSLVVYREIEPVERLFRAIYRPQNIYCIHVDAKSNPTFYQAMESLVSCFSNAFLTSRRVDVRWSQFSVLEPELICMEELYKRAANWRYFINLTGQEFPLKSNRELVEILTAYKGANDVEGVRKKANKLRWEKSGTAPSGVTPTKGSVHVALNREFVKWVITDQRSKALQDWVRPQETSDETFFSTINHNPQLGAPGSFIGLDDVERMNKVKPWFGRYKKWGDMPCAGRRVHGICILTIGDLPSIHTSPYFFANKFKLYEDRIAYGCLEQRLHNRTREIHMGRMHVNTTIYAESIIVRNRLRVEDIGLKYHEPGQGHKLEWMKNQGVGANYVK